jgi:hypothetical protein
MKLYLVGRRNMKKYSLWLALCLGSALLASCASSESLTAPSGLTVTSGVNKVDLAWEDNSDNEAGFRIFRKLEGGSYFTELQETTPNAETYTDTSVTSSGRYVYEVRAFTNDGNLSAPAAIGEAVAVTILATPTDLTATPGEGKIDLTWTDASDNEEGFRIFRKLESDAEFPVDALSSVGAEGASYSDTSVSTDSVYVYQVVAFAGSSVSEASSSSAPVTPVTPTEPTPNPEPEPEPVTESLEGEWQGELEGVGNVALSVDEDLDGDENSQRHNAIFNYLDNEGNSTARFFFECRVKGSTFKCNEIDANGDVLGDNDIVITGEFTDQGKISGTFKPFNSQELKTLTLERVNP